MDNPIEIASITLVEGCVLFLSVYKNDKIDSFSLYKEYKHKDCFRFYTSSYSDRIVSFMLFKIIK